MKGSWKKEKRGWKMRGRSGRGEKEMKEDEKEIGRRRWKR